MTFLFRTLSVLALLALGLTTSALITAPGAQAGSTDPVTQDTPEIDRESPPGLISPQIFSQGAQMNALLYTANGPGPHPTVLLLHGFPGNEKNLDLAQALRRAGFNVLFFHYRGAWGSAGDYSLPGVLDDIVAALKFLQEKSADPEFRIDPERISLAGHSLGGFGALATGIEHRDMICTVAMAPADLGASLGPLLASKPDLSAPQYTAAMPGLKNYGYGSLIADTAKDLPRYTLNARMAAFKDRALLIVSADQDEAVPLEINLALAEAARAAGASPFEHLVLDADHSFSWNRVEFTRLIVRWMSEHCR